MLLLLLEPWQPFLAKLLEASRLVPLLPLLSP
jgi:hypothetical protein